MDPKKDPFGNKHPPGLHSPHPSPPPPGWVAEPGLLNHRQTGPGFKENEDSPLSTRLPHGGLRAARHPVSPPAAETRRPPRSLPPAPWNNQLRTRKVCSAQGQGETHAWGRRAGWCTHLGENSSWEITQGPCHYPEDQLGILSLQFRGGGWDGGGSGGGGCGRDCGPGKPPDQAPGRGSDPPLSHQGAPLLFQCF